MKCKINKFLQRIAIVSIAVGVVGCSNFFVGEENSATAVDLPSNPGAVALTMGWHQQVGDGTDDRALSLTPLVGKERVIAVDATGKLQAFAVQNGERLWSQSIGQTIAAGVGGNAYFAVVGSENGLLMAFDAQTGQPGWRYQLSTEIMATPNVVGDLVIARAIDGQVTALDARNGQVVWKQHIGVADLSIRGNARGVVLGKEILFTNGKGRITLLAIADGKPIFSAPVVVGRGITAVARLADLLATPVIRNGLLFVSAYRHKTVAINMQDGGLLWESPHATSKDLFADNRYLYLIDKDSVIRALDMRNGKVAWTNRDLLGRHISPLAGDGRLLVTADFAGIMNVINAANGELLGYSSVGSGTTYTAPQWLNGRWLNFSGDGDLSLFGISAD